MKIADFWKKFDREWDVINHSTLIVQGDTALTENISAYKLYINGNIHGMGKRFIHLAPPNSIYVRLKAGGYRIVLREYDAWKPDRMESNTLSIEIHHDEQIMIRASLREGQLVLSVENIAQQSY
jgi:hypothetical protein